MKYHPSQKVCLINRKVLNDGTIVVNNDFYKNGEEHLTIAGATKLPNGIVLYSFEHKSPEYRLTDRELELNRA